MNSDDTWSERESTTTVIEREVQVDTDPVDPPLTGLEKGAMVTVTGDMVNLTAKDGLYPEVRDTDNVVDMDSAVMGGRHPAIPGLPPFTSPRGEAGLAGAPAASSPIVPLSSQTLIHPGR